jgi:hypothetical protein
MGSYYFDHLFDVEELDLPKMRWIISLYDVSSPLANLAFTPMHERKQAKPQRPFFFFTRRFVHEITQLQGSKQNLPPSSSTTIDPLSSTSNDADQRLEKGEEDAEMIKSEVDVEETRPTASNLRNRSRRVS